MEFYSDYSRQYVADVCEALNKGGFQLQTGFNESSSYHPDKIKSLTYLLQNEVVMSLQKYDYLNSKGLVNRGRCPYTGSPVNNSSRRWTYMGSRTILLSDKGHEIMQTEDDKEYEELFGKPRASKTEPTRSSSTSNSGASGGCYIATVCYGSANAPQVLVLKKYRDEVLLKSNIGRLFVKFYYLVSPSVAKRLKNKSHINKLVKDNFLEKIVLKIAKRK